MAISIVDYGMGNLHSVTKAVQRLGHEALVTGEREEILSADGIILPGVGAFGDAMEQLRETSLDSVMQEAADAGKPLLGICLGMQLLFSRSEEHGNHEGLNILPGSVVRFKEGDYKVPHMGWNSLQFAKREHPLFAGLEEGHVYFVHSYHVLPEAKADLLAVTDYGQPVTAIVGRGSVYGMQFHPEKSGEMGMSLLNNFLSLT
ncbi:imidazole glycerol phosphate synthase subunit HisH [Paenibacillus sp. JCM 10914]|uniref:imidazole glycerol phosphate synthase subunit HisH n=1 Tax=Paenibacillus sp. JCM 10914 TaxID=1236974 RepID=UPI0003CC5464|nr:imidazole glycerol phosphate synthase subunit HisH [Paenibacillus sp. JCM 10914]GAE08643.1 imidazole glycerol phosphate synthase amidotransferase subunit [Paenibacillus sp. JCM 10914]